jgi:hypothetical protein
MKFRSNYRTEAQDICQSSNREKTFEVLDFLFKFSRNRERTFVPFAELKRLEALNRMASDEPYHPAL